MRIHEVDIRDFRVVVIEASRSCRVISFDSHSVESLDHLFLGLAISESELDGASACAFVSEVVDVSSGVNDMSDSSDLLEFVNMGFFGKTCKVEFNHLSIFVSDGISIIKPSSVKHRCLHFLLLCNCRMHP